MHLTHIRCKHFRNHTDFRASFSAKCHFVFGPNGTGKTSLLDAIHYLCCAKSALHSLDAQNVQHGQEAFDITGTFQLDGDDHTVACRFDHRTGKHMRCNGVRYDALKDHIGRFPVVFTSPYDVELIRGGSHVRRRFVDLMLCQQSKTYLQALLHYQKALKQRNALLQSSRPKVPLDLDLMEGYDQHLIRYGTYIAAERSALMARMAPLLARHAQLFAAAEAPMALTYVSDGLETDFAQKFRSALSKDRILRRTTVGIHRDDFAWTLDGQPLKTVGSQGEQKYALLALRLAQLQCISQRTAATPLLLMDDVFDSLDRRRATLLVELIQSPICPGQVLVTHSEITQSGALGKHIRSVGPSLALSL